MYMCVHAKTNIFMKVRGRRKSAWCDKEILQTKGMLERFDFYSSPRCFGYQTVVWATRHTQL